MKKILPFILCNMIFLSIHLMANLPLTSTIFYKSYESDYTIIRKLNPKKSQKLTNEQARFLVDEDVELGARLALINKLGWNSAGLTNTTRFMNYLGNENVNIILESDFVYYEFSDRADILAILGYLLAMDNYNEPNDGLFYADLALDADPESLSVHMVYALINAQNHWYDDNLCDIYETIFDVADDEELYLDLKPKALDDILEHAILYEKYCEHITN